MVVHHQAGNSSSAAGEGIHFLNKADKNMLARWSELRKKRGFVGLDPGIDGRRPFDGRGLLPALAGRRGHHDAVLARSKVFDERESVDIGQNFAAARRIDAAVRVIGRAQRIPEDVRELPAAGDTVTAAGVKKLDIETCKALLLGQIGYVVDGLVVLEYEDGDLGRGNGPWVEGYGHIGLSHCHGRAPHGEAYQTRKVAGKYRHEVPLGIR